MRVDFKIRTGAATRAACIVLSSLLFASCEETRQRHQPMVAAEPKPVEIAPAAPFQTGPSELAPSVTQTSGRTITKPEIYPGRGVSVKAPVTPGPAVSDEAKVTLNFVDTDVREVIDAVLGDILNLGYVVDPAVQGSVTVRTSDALPRNAVLPALESALALSGIGLVREGGLYKVVPLEAAAGFSQPSMQRLAASVAGYGVHLIPLNFTDVGSIATLLNPFVRPGRVLQVDVGRNLLIFAGPSNEARELQDMVSLLDADWMSGMSFGLFPVEEAELEALIIDLDAVLTGPDESGLANALRFIPIERMRAILAIAPSTALLDQVGTWIRRLDRGEEGPGRRIFVYYVQNSRASELAQVLGDIFQGSAQQTQVVEPSLAPGRAPAEISTPPEATGETGEEALPEPTVQQASAPSDQRFGFTPFFDAGSSGIGLDDTSEVRIIAQESRNALVILATAAQWRVIEDTLQRLDVVPLQVLIEATIAEITLNDQLSYGVEWFFEFGDSSLTFSRRETGAVTSNFPGFSYLFAGGDARIVLNALDEVTDVQVISSPQLMVLDNETARIQVGDQVPIVTQQSTGTLVEDTRTVNSVQYIDTGVILEVTPRVNASGLVTLELVQEVSEAQRTATSEIDSPTIEQRSIASTVVVNSGDSIALGGLIQSREEQAESGVPVLKDIPLLGNLFKVTDKFEDRTELLVMIRPQVVRSSLDAREVTEELRLRLRSLEPLERKVYLQ